MSLNYWWFVFDTIWVIIMRIWWILIQSEYEYLTIFLFWHHPGLYTMQKPLYIGKIVLVSIWIGMVFFQIITQVYKNDLTLTSPSKYQYLICRFLETNIDVDYWYHMFTSNNYNNEHRCFTMVCSSRNGGSTWHANLTWSVQNDAGWCHFAHFVLDWRVV